MDTAIGGLRKRLKNGRSLDENVVVDHAADIIADIDDKANNKGITTDSSSTTATNVINATRTTYSNRRWLLYVYYLLHIMATTCFIFGFVFRGIYDLHNGTECDMTYSHRTYIEIDTTTKTTPSRSASSSSKLMSQYKLYKFVDKRDPRYYSLWSAADPRDQQRHTPLTADGSQSQQWCIGNVAKAASESSDSASIHDNQRPIVLYVPGHWGSYEQSRSIGAHGIQLTRSRSTAQYTKKIQNLLYNGGSSSSTTSLSSTTTSTTPQPLDLNEFIYDVYALDFNEQGTALHGEFIIAQSEFIIKSIKLLVETCNVSSVTIVAHSMGGYSARLAAASLASSAAATAAASTQKQQNQQLIHNIITLATPHNNPLYSWEKSIYDIHQRLMMQQQRPQEENNEDSNKLFLVSLSGGLRDEMIEPNSCNIINSNSGSKENNAEYSSSTGGVTALSSRLISKGSLGMDHQAIVWCHDVLEVVREIIWVLSSSPSSISTSEEHEVSGSSGGGSQQRLVVEDRTREVERRLDSFRQRNSGRRVYSGSTGSSKDYTEEVQDLEIAFRVSCFAIFSVQKSYSKIAV